MSRRSAIPAVLAALAALSLGPTGCGRDDGENTPAFEAGSDLAPIAEDQLVVATGDRQIRVVDEKGGMIRVLDDGSGLGTGQVRGIDVSPDGRRVLVSVLDDHDEASSATVFEATDNGVCKLLDGALVALDPVGDRIAYLRYEKRRDYCFRTELVVRDADGEEAAWPVPGGESVEGTPRCGR